ncbi:hypothetical protein L1987_67081 [Smallanthus sonchifolius]|uniref:Uncharacterized protein n=1 Tax=Smallanthus sonchifolius TaxID=185202 RepID=A0ACB9BZ93_9ASTR|nr:hypothetical protein L1987_67081 [Smallanthus sonchifolius]
MEDFKGGNKSNNENDLNPEMGFELKSSCKKQLPAKSFMKPTISTAIKATIPTKKILSERNETVEQPSLQRSSSFGSKPVRFSVFDSDGDVKEDFVGKPYDPVLNYLSPRPKFLRYNPNRRRTILDLQENDEDRVMVSDCIPSSGLESGLGSSVTSDSCSQQESVEEAHAVNNEENEDENGEDDEEEMVEFGEDTGNGPIMEPDFLVGRLKEEDVYGQLDQLDMSEPIEVSVEVKIAKTDDYVHQDEVQNDDSNVIQDELLLQEHEVKASKVMETDYMEAETVHDFNEDGLVEEDDSDANENNPRNDAEFETANDMEDGADKQFDDIKTNDVLSKFTSSDLTVTVVIGHILILASFIVIHCSKFQKSSAASVITPVKNLEPSSIPQSIIQQKEEETFVTSVPVSEVHIPSVELLVEFVFGEEITSNVSTGDSHPLKKQQHTSGYTISSEEIKPTKNPILGHVSVRSNID